MTNQNEFLSIKEASILTRKSELTIRRLIKSKKVECKLTNQWYIIDKNSLSVIYPLIYTDTEKSINQVISQEVNQDLSKIIEPLINRITFLDNEKDRVNHLLVSGQEEIKKKEQELGLIIRKKDLIIKILFWVVIGLAVIFVIFFLLAKWVILINWRAF